MPLAPATPPTPGVLVKLHVANEMNGRFGIVFEESGDWFRVRVCTTMEEPLKIVRAKKEELEAIEMCVLLYANLESSKHLERFEDAMESINPLLQNDVDADFRPLILLSYYIDEGLRKTELGQRLESRDEDAQTDAGGASGLKKKTPPGKMTITTFISGNETERRSIIRRVEEPMSPGQHFSKLQPLIPVNSWSCFQDADSLSCSTRFAAFLEVLQQLDAPEGAKEKSSSRPPAAATIGRVFLNVQAGWWPGMLERVKKDKEFERPRNAEEVDQLFEALALGVQPAPRNERLYPYLFRTKACFGPKDESGPTANEQDAKAIPCHFNKCATEKALLAYFGERMEESSMCKTKDWQPVDFEGTPQSAEDPLDWAYMPDALLV
ncbi:unnamed protein product [Amoebophrya sp. A25]|nr:unnamed protein product [Amoebophrya sp. A25]|eukprot:GSA25T00002377001.1